MNPAKKLVKSRTTTGLRSAIGELGNEWKLYRRHRQALKRVPQFLNQLPIKLNLGCGPNRKPDWVNIDLYHPSADLQLDLREPWPFPDASVSYIYSEHVFEHFEFTREVPHFLQEAQRVLCAGGVFDVGVPDTEWPLRDYHNPEERYFHTSMTQGWHPQWCQTELDHINYHFRQDKEHGEHKYAWDKETLERTLRNTGFTSITRREFDPSLDTESRRLGTLYMQASKRG